MLNLDLSALSIEDIIEEYKLLHERHQQLKERSEEDAQRLHELKRSLDTALAAERYLTQELEQLSTQPQASTPTCDPRAQQDFEELQRKHRSLKLEHETLQQDYDAKADEVSDLKAKLANAIRDLETNTLLKSSTSDEEYTARLNALEQENAELMQKLTEYEDYKVERTLALAEQEKTIEILKDQIDCLEQNMRSKRDELEEKLQLLESAQEQLGEANAKIAMLSSAPDQNDRKGNSLFAEVDDQRQVMKQLLANQKKSYLEMKKIFNESKFEIHRLKRENKAMHTELEACSTIFCSADRTYQNKLNERIRQLTQQNARLEKNLNLSQERLRELAKEKSVTWLDSMLDFCKRETDEMKAQLHSLHLQQATLEDKMRNVQQDMARWRFESLKSRCVLIDRENLLTEHNIAFKPMQAMEFNITESQLQSALPRILSAMPTREPNLAATAEGKATELPVKVEVVNKKEEIINLVTPIKTEPSLDTTENQENQPEIKAEVEELSIKESPSGPSSPSASSSPLGSASPGTDSIKVKSEEQLMPTTDSSVPSKPQRKGTPVKWVQIKRESIEDEQEESPVPAKPQRKGTPVKPKEEPFDGICDAKPLRKGTPVRVKAGLSSQPEETCQVPGRSILITKRDLFADENQKNVRFNQNGPIVHNLSPHEQDDKPVKKSANIIRHIIVPSRLKPANS